MISLKEFMLEHFECPKLSILEHFECPKLSILERLNLTKNSKLNSTKPNYFIVFGDKKFATKSIILEPYIYYKFDLYNLPGPFIEAYIFYYDELMIKKITGFLNKTHYNEIVGCAIMPKKYDDKDKFKKFESDLLDGKITLDDLEFKDNIKEFKI